jgi:hypothetical protein
MAAGDIVFQVFLAFQTYVSSVSSKCYKNWLRMLQWQYPHVASLRFNCFICLRRLFQMFDLDVLKVDLVLHLLQCLYTHISSVSSVFATWMFQK